MKIEIIKASKHSYGAKRDKGTVQFIVIHYTGVKRDTARGEGAYFKSGNTRSAGAHFFVDRNGAIVKSVPMNYVAWSVGGSKYVNCNRTGGGQYYRICRNSNSVSIEMCDCVDRDPSEKQIAAVRWLIKYIRIHGCKNAKSIIRHFDVTGKPCPARLTDNKKWREFKAKIA